MGNTTKKLGELLDHLDSENLLLPEIQRDFVWDMKNILKLFDSLYHELPIGNVLVWKAKHSVGAKKLRAPIHRIGKPLDGFYGYLLDGQQRLTAVKLVRDDPDKYPLMFNMLSALKNEEPFTWKARWNESSPWYISVSRVLFSGFHALDVIDELKNEEEYDPKVHRSAIDQALRRLQDILRYDIGIIEYDEDDYQKATELFIRFNSTGKKLSKPELALAQLALAAPKLVSEGIGKLQDRHPGFRFTNPFLLQCLVSIHATRMKIDQPERIWEKSDERSIRSSWRNTEKGVDRIVEFLTGTIQWDATSWVPSMVTLVPLLYVFGLGGKPNPEERRLAKKWLLLANTRAIFTGKGYHKFEALFRYLKNDPSMETLWRYTHRGIHPQKIKPEDFNTKRKSGAIMSLYVALLRGHHAEDWKRETLLNGRVIGDNAELQVHHFFPQALLREHRFSSDDINTFANYTIISKDTNLECRVEEPAEYIQRLKIDKRHLKAQCVPLNRSLWKVDRYKDFLEERRRLLAQQANKFLG
ncbi:MAG: DUF262 domain-containing protein [Myxococcales bacterium]|nr:MAG: DUF262 domain-containing protein [Myxococcales bacterium]